MIHFLTVCTRAFIAAFIFFFIIQNTHASLFVPIEIKEVQGVGSQGYPVSIIVPLPYGEFQETHSLGVVDSSGSEIPSAISVLNRWWAKDNSIRHVQVFLQPDVNPFKDPGTGVKKVYLTVLESDHDNIARVKHSSPINVIDTDTEISVNTGPLQFTVSKEKFNLIENVSLYGNKLLLDDSKHVVFTDKNGKKKFDSSRQNVEVVLEEYNDLRTVIRAESRSSFANEHTQGFAVRIYAYAGKEYVKIDYQLQNSPIDSQFAGPLYFESLEFNFNIAIQGEKTTRIGLDNGEVFQTRSFDGVNLKQTSHDEFIVEAGNKLIKAGTQSSGFVSVSGQNGGVMATTRNFWQMWPNGLATTTDNSLKIELYPHWSAQWHEQQVSPTGLYWLDDMQHVYKEVLLYFHNASVTNEQLSALAKTFAFPPVGSLEPAWYAQTKATLDLGGYVSTNLPVSDDLSRTVSYSDVLLDKSNARYNFNVENFLIDTYRKRGHHIPGNYPYSGSAFIASRNPKDLYVASQKAIGELNVRPQWLAGYNHNEHYELIQPTSNPYGGISWRRFVNHYTSHLEADYIDGTSQDSAPRGDSHGWFYHVEDSYYLTGNLWIKDWYKFIGQFRKTRLFQLDPYPNMVSRAQAHSLSNALQAYKVTGDVELLNLLTEYVWTYIEPVQKELRSGALKNKEAAFQLGFATRFLINLYNEVNPNDSHTKLRLFNIISGNVQWNMTYANYSYYIIAEDGVSNRSSGSGASFVDPQAWYALQTQNRAYLDHIQDYLDNGVNGGTRAYEQLRSRWTGDFYGRLSQIARESEADLAQPAPAIFDLTLSQQDGEVLATFSLPETANTFFLLTSPLPFSETQTLDDSMTNWWSGNVVTKDVKAPANGAIEFQFNADTVGNLYVVAFYINTEGKLSEISNQANVFIDSIKQDPNLGDNLTDSTLLVDFGSNAKLNTFGIEDWNEVLSDAYNGYVDGGLTISIGSNGKYNFQGVRGTARLFNVDDVIAVTWKNTSDEVMAFIPKISFTDPDRANSGETGAWYSMSPVKVAPGESSISVFVFNHETAGNYFLVNTTVNVDHQNALVADKILILKENPLNDVVNKDEPFLFDFIKRKVSEIFSLPGWFELNLDTYTTLGEFGTFANLGQNNYQAVSGPPVSIRKGMKIIAHWKNIGPDFLEFTPQISINDSDRRLSGIRGDWYPMTTAKIPPENIGTSSFDMSQFQADSFRMVNISNNVDSRGKLILTGIQIVDSGEVQFAEQ